MLERSGASGLWSREKQVRVWENFSALSVETGAEVSLQPTTPSRAHLKAWIHT